MVKFWSNFRSNFTNKEKKQKQRKTKTKKKEEGEVKAIFLLQSLKRWNTEVSV